MPPTLHVEKHFTASETVRDIMIGMLDRLTVPFALAAGSSGAVGSSGIIVTAGLTAGAIARGLGGQLAARTDAEQDASERAREEWKTQQMPEADATKVADVLRSQGLEDGQVRAVVNSFRADKKRWVGIMMRFELGLEAPDPRRAYRSALTIASALIGSVTVTLAVLLVFGYIKGRFTTAKPFRSAWQTVVVGGLAATAAFVMTPMLLLRAFAVWLVIIAAETVHGILRGLLLVPLVGDLPARQIGVPIGSLLIFAVAYLGIRWIAARTKLQLVGVGLLWVVLTVLFEIGLGRLVLDLPWNRITEDYGPARGSFLGLLFMAVSPLLAARLRGSKSLLNGSSP